MMDGPADDGDKEHEPIQGPDSSTGPMKDGPSPDDLVETREPGTSKDAPASALFRRPRERPREQSGLFRRPREQQHDSKSSYGSAGSAGHPDGGADLVNVATAPASSSISEPKNPNGMTTSTAVKIASSMTTAADAGLGSRTTGTSKQDHVSAPPPAQDPAPTSVIAPAAASASTLVSSSSSAPDAGADQHRGDGTTSLTKKLLTLISEGVLNEEEQHALARTISGKIGAEEPVGSLTEELRERWKMMNASTARGVAANKAKLQQDDSPDGQVDAVEFTEQQLLRSNQGGRKLGINKGVLGVQLQATVGEGVLEDQIFDALVGTLKSSVQECRQKGDAMKDELEKMQEALDDARQQNEERRQQDEEQRQQNEERLKIQEEKTRDLEAGKKNTDRQLKNTERQLKGLQDAKRQDQERIAQLEQAKAHQDKRTAALELAEQRRTAFEHAQYQLGEIASMLEIFFKDPEWHAWDETVEDAEILREIKRVLDEVLSKWSFEQHTVVRELDRLWRKIRKPSNHWRIVMCSEVFEQCLLAYAVHVEAVRAAKGVLKPETKGVLQVVLTSWRKWQKEVEEYEESLKNPVETGPAPEVEEPNFFALHRRQLNELPGDDAAPDASKNSQLQVEQPPTHHAAPALEQPPATLGPKKSSVNAARQRDVLERGGKTSSAEQQNKKPATSLFKPASRVAAGPSTTGASGSSSSSGGNSKLGNNYTSAKEPVSAKVGSMPLRHKPLHEPKYKREPFFAKIFDKATTSSFAQNRPAWALKHVGASGKSNAPAGESGASSSSSSTSRLAQNKSGREASTGRSGAALEEPSALLGPRPGGSSSSSSTGNTSASGSARVGREARSQAAVAPGAAGQLYDPLTGRRVGVSTKAPRSCSAKNRKPRVDLVAPCDMKRVEERAAEKALQQK
ncbi:unnamed protein product [Amoebophrya sp. A120]|nr:unnamed protein product [Amoebophrya sp. A120]|eukprot:GSA120T00023801001.1